MCEGDTTRVGRTPSRSGRAGGLEHCGRVSRLSLCLGHSGYRATDELLRVMGCAGTLGPLCLGLGRLPVMAVLGSWRAGCAGVKDGNEGRWAVCVLGDEGRDAVERRRGGGALCDWLNARALDMDSAFELGVPWSALHLFDEMKDRRPQCKSAGQ